MSKDEQIELLKAEVRRLEEYVRDFSEEIEALESALASATGALVGISYE